MGFSSFTSLEKQTPYQHVSYYVTEIRSFGWVRVYFASAAPSMLSELVLDLQGQGLSSSGHWWHSARWTVSSYSGVTPWGIHECIFLELCMYISQHTRLSWLQMWFKSLFRVSLWLYFRVHLKINEYLFP